LSGSLLSRTTAINANTKRASPVKGASLSLARPVFFLVSQKQSFLLDDFFFDLGGRFLYSFLNRFLGRLQRSRGFAFTMNDDP
jgi:hypothetical protein